MRCYCVMQHGQPFELMDQAIRQPQGTGLLRLQVKAVGVHQGKVIGRTVLIP